MLVDLKRWNPCMATNTLFIFIAFIIKKHLRLIDQDPSDIFNKVASTLLATKESSLVSGMTQVTD